MILLLIILLLLSVGGYPGWGWHNYGYWPSGFTLLFALVVLVLLFRGRL